MSVQTIDYDTILETALRGIRRAAVFMGLGLNAAYDPEYKKYSLIDITAIDLIPHDLPDETVDDFKKNFATWITGNGLREVIESFGIFLDQVYDASSRIALSKKALGPDEARRNVRDFKNKTGIKAKLELLRKDFGIACERTDEISAIHLARNALSHNRGQIAKKHCNEQSALVLKWIGIDYILSEKDKEPMVLDTPIQRPVYVEKGGKIGVKLTERNRTFKLGQIIRIPAKDLAEICWFISEEARKLVKSGLEYADKMGISIKQNVNEAGKARDI